jgi:predicted glycoside hydrolase/deacetylase ChbG (UPF0249 family)
MTRLFSAICLTGMFCATAAFAQDDQTYAERLGWPKGAKVVIFHADDAGMCWEANEGIRRSFEEGVLTSASTMMPCPWVPGWNHYLKENPDIDNGLHLTLTSEWEDYGWGPVAGKTQVPGLVDPDGCLWDSVQEVIENASADEVEAEIRAQIERAETMGMPITHIDSHMGTLFAHPEYFERYAKVGIEKQIPILIADPDGHLLNLHEPGAGEMLRGLGIGEKVWAAGLPVLDDVTGQSYGWKTLEEKKAQFVDILRNLHPGVTELIVHPTETGDHFTKISESSSTRQADLDVMIDPEIRQIIEEEGIILTTWRELKQRRDQVEGWVSLFDGTSLDGWIQKNGPATYRVEDGIIIGTTKPLSINSFLCSAEEYGNFELEFDVKLFHNELNSGVQIRSKTEEARGKQEYGRVNGPQVEIEASGENGAEAGYIYGEACGGWMTPEAELIPLKVFKDGEWNHYRIVAEGPRIQTWINGEQIEDLVDDEKFASHPKGFIGLQVHGIGKDQGPFEVAWKNIRIRPLD